MDQIDDLALETWQRFSVNIQEIKTASCHLRLKATATENLKPENNKSSFPYIAILSQAFIEPAVHKRCMLQ